MSRLSAPEHAPRLVLASASPRRKQLLEQAGYKFEVRVSNVVEDDPRPGEKLEAYVMNLAWRKAAAVADHADIQELILAADTACAVECEILNKPIDRDDALRMIRLQEGRHCDVFTGICLFRPRTRDWIGAVEKTVISFKPLSDADRTRYLDSNEWVGKAGAYGVQDDDPLVTIVSGSWTNVVGLPMERLRTLLETYPNLAANA